MARGQVDEWVSRAEECARMACPLLLDECQAVDVANPAIWSRLETAMGRLTERRSWRRCLAR